MKKKRKTKEWESYEDAVRSIFDQHREFFGLEEVEPAPGTLPGKSGNKWNIEIIAYSHQRTRRILVEVKRYKTNDVTQEQAGGLAFRIAETGSHRGYFVTPLGRGLQLGAKKVALAHKIEHIEVSADATPGEYIMRYMNQMFSRNEEDVSHIIAGIKEEFRTFIIDAEGNQIEVDLTKGYP
jgi:hypothetical protein